MLVRFVRLACLAIVGVAGIATTAFGEVVNYIIGRDSRPAMIGGTYDGLDNPNYNRMTMLYAHWNESSPASNHYHSKGTYSYTGANNGAATLVNDFNGTFGTSNILPESPAVNDVWMMPGTGDFDGMFRTGLTNSLPFNNLRFRTVNSLDGFADGTPENYMFNSSSGRFNGLLGSEDVFLNLESISSGLSIRDASGNVLMDAAGQSFNLGAGDSIDFTPIFTVDDSVAGGSKYQAVFTLSSPGSSWGDGGRFVMQVTAVPEPASMALVGLPLVGFAIRRSRKRRQAKAEALNA